MPPYFVVPWWLVLAWIGVAAYLWIGVAAHLAAIVVGRFRPSKPAPFDPDGPEFGSISIDSLTPEDARRQSEAVIDQLAEGSLPAVFEAIRRATADGKREAFYEPRASWDVRDSIVKKMQARGWDTAQIIGSIIIRW